ncbi:MAG: cytochrome c biogenesis protein CcdA [Actinobacteria bacterium]|nr:cytochrome c biogenesis protein CcdA [Actinomycetota bacterium]
MSEVLAGTTLLTAFLAGMVALFAPCCVSVTFPAYLAAASRRRAAQVAMTFAFAAGIATLILPIAMGASWIAGRITEYHLIVYGVGALLMAGLGVATLAGWHPHLPMPSRRPDPVPGPGAAYLLGLFSGVASACCAPVVAGVIAVAGASASFTVALAVGVFYVFGMVAPLFVMALLWDRYGSRFERLASRRARVPFSRRTLPVANLIGGILLLAMAALVAVLAITGPQMNAGGWPSGVAAYVDHLANVASSGLSTVPGVVIAAVLVTALFGLGWIAARQSSRRAASSGADDPPALARGPGSDRVTDRELPRERIDHR